MPAIENFEILDVDDIEPNTWNFNRMTDRQIEHLKREILRTEKLSSGGLDPIVVVKFEDRDKYTIIDGEHRWRERKFLAENGHPGFRKVNAIVIRGITEREAKILTHNLNKIRGEPDPRALAELVVDLHKDMSYDEISDLLGYDDLELEMMETMLSEPEDLDEEFEKEESEYVTFSCQIPAEDAELVKRTISDVRMEERIKERGKALVHIMKEYNRMKGAENE